MSKLSTNPATDELGKLWGSWAELVARLLSKRRKLFPISEARYHEAYSKLQAALAAAHKQPDSVAPLTEKDLAELLEFSRPWLNLDAVQSADRRVLRNLVKRSGDLCFENFGFRPTSHFVTHLIQLVAATSLLTILLAGTVGKTTTLAWSSDVSVELRSQAYRALYMIGRYSGLEWLGIATCVVVIVGVWMMSSTRDW